MLHGGAGWSVLLCVVHLFHIGNLYFPQDARHDFIFVRVCPEDDALKRVTRMLRALCSQTRSLNLTSQSSTKNATISLHITANSPCVASLPIVQRNHSTQTLNMRLWPQWPHWHQPCWHEQTKESQHYLFVRERVWRVWREQDSYFLILLRSDSYFGDTLQNAKQLFFGRLPQMIKYFVMRECDDIPTWITGRNFLFSNFLKGFRISLVQRSHLLILSWLSLLVSFIDSN